MIRLTHIRILRLLPYLLLERERPANKDDSRRESKEVNKVSHLLSILSRSYVAGGTTNVPAPQGRRSTIMRSSADLSGLSSRRLLLVIVALMAALAAALAVYFSLGARPAEAYTALCGYPEQPVRNLGPGHPNALIPIFDPQTCEQVGTVHDKFMGESLKRYVSEQYILRNVEPLTTFQAYVWIWFFDAGCEQNGAPFVQKSLSFTTDKNGNGRATLDVPAPGTPGSVIPPEATNATHCFVYVFEANNGTIQYRTPGTAAYEDVPGRPPNV
jgi:hypothetical protein